MKDITFHVPDDTVVMHLVLIRSTYNEAHDCIEVGVNGAFYDLRYGKTDFSPGDYEKPHMI